jgi:hypothetical protein
MCWGREPSPKSAILVFPLMTLHMFCIQTSHVICNFTSTLLDKLSTCIVSYWCTLCIACVCENDLVLLVSHTKLPSLCTPHTNAIHECMFHACHSKIIPIHLEWYSCGVTCIVSSCIFHVIFLLENFQVITIGILLPLM